MSQVGSQGAPDRGRSPQPAGVNLGAHFLARANLDFRSRGFYDECCLMSSTLWPREAQGVHAVWRLPASPQTGWGARVENYLDVDSARRPGMLSAVSHSTSNSSRKVATRRGSRRISRFS